MPEESKTFWDIEEEKTWRIYILFGFLIVLYFIPIFAFWIVIKFVLHLRFSIPYSDSPFSIFGTDTLFVLLVAAVASAIHWYYSNAKVVTRILHLLGAQHPDKRDKYHYIFRNVVDEIETSAGGLKVERYILPTGAMNAFALADFNGRQVIGVTEGLLSRLTRDELQAVVAHEMAHIVSNDCLQTTAVCSLFGLYSEALAQFNRVLSTSEGLPKAVMTKAAQQNATALGMLSIPLLFLLFITDVLGHLLNMFISREKEYRADASAVKFTRNPLSLASALYKIGTHWRGAGYSGEYLSPIFILSPGFNQLDEKESVFGTLFSTHPPLLKRLQIILNLAQADFESITQHLGRRKGPKIEEEMTKPVVRLLAQHDNKWEGPFTLLQLQSLAWLEPETRLRIAGSDETINAVEIPALSHYFQKRDEPMWKMRRLCPDCRQWLIVQEYEGLYVWRCAFCNGILAEQDRLPRIFVRKEKGFPGRVQRLATLLLEDAQRKHPRFNLLLDMSHPRRCPKCGKPMRHKFYSYAYHVEIDECSVCNITWFDADELEILQCLIEIGEKS